MNIKNILKSMNVGSDYESTQLEDILAANLLVAREKVGEKSNVFKLIEKIHDIYLREIETDTIILSNKPIDIWRSLKKPKAVMSSKKWKDNFDRERTNCLKRILTMKRLKVC